MVALNALQQKAVRRVLIIAFDSSFLCGGQIG
jgi:hypothetical protein